MIVGLLYKERDWGDDEPYFDQESIIKDLDLRILFDMASKEIVWEGEQVREVLPSERFLARTMEKIMVAPLRSKEEIIFRQDILKDCMENPAFLFNLYDFAGKVKDEWAALGRGTNIKSGALNTPGELIHQIHVINLFCDSLGYLKRVLAKMEGELHSEGFCMLRKRLDAAFSEEYEGEIRNIMSDISFYAYDGSIGAKKVAKPNLRIDMSYDNGFKFTGWELMRVETDVVKYYKPDGTLRKLQKHFGAVVPNSISVEEESPFLEEAQRLQYHTVSYVLQTLTPFVNEFRNFFDQLQLQTAFYKACLFLQQHMNRMKIQYCFPKVVEQHNLKFVELKEVIMSLGQKIPAVGNSIEIEKKNLMIVTGANQGGKSTFLRSVAIAQLMMQAGMMVGAQVFESGIYPEFFTHFTRREDSEMNSGRLDEELGRMSEIIDQIGDRSVIYLNESFATTTEKDGSRIAYDIIRALQERGVEIMTVTHLLGFATRMYEEDREDIEFLSAERKENGKRTFRMIQGEPTLSSFGLDLYDEIIGK